MELGHFLLCLAQLYRRTKSLGHGLAVNPARQAEVGTVPGIIAFGTVTARLAALAGSGRDRTSPEIADGDKLTEQVGSFSLQLRQRVIHGGPPYLSVHRR